MSPATSTAAHTTVSGRHITCRTRHAVLPTAPVPDAHKCAMSAPRSSRGAVARGDGGSWGTAAAQGKRGGEGGRPSRARRRSSWRARQWSRPTCLSCSVRLQGGVAREAKVLSSADSAEGGKARQQAVTGICGFEEAGDGAHEDEWRLACAHAAWRCCGSHG